MKKRLSKMIKWILVNKNIHELRENPKNPRTLSKEQAKHLKTSISKFGLSDKPIINQNGLIIGGHQRLKILAQMGYNSVECWMPEIPLSDNEAEELCLRLNKNTGEFDFDVLANEWDQDLLNEVGFLDAELGITEEIEEPADKKEKEKKLKMCPSCGHEF